MLYRELAALRQANPAVRRGRLVVLDSGVPDVLRWRRELDDQTGEHPIGSQSVEVWLNASPGEVQLPAIDSDVLLGGGGDVLGPWGWVVVRG